MNSVTHASKRCFWLGLLLLFTILILLAVLPVYASAYNVMLMCNILMYIIITVSWVLFSGPTGYISLASAAFFGIGIYTSAILGQILPLLAVVVVGGLASFILALFVGLITLRLRGMYFSIFTFGLVELVKHFLLWWEINITGTRGRFVFGVDYATVYYIMFVILMVLVLTAYLIRRSKYGLALQSIGENEEAASHIGINVTVLKIAAFALSAFFIGTAGTIMATRWTYVDPFIAFDPFRSFMPVLMAIFGGMAQLYGPVIGATIFAYLEEELITRFPYHYMLIFGIIMVVSILYLPDGLIGLGRKLIGLVRMWQQKTQMASKIRDKDGRIEAREGSGKNARS
jgi:branched-chain amino acid transport system permease protein